MATPIHRLESNGREGKQHRLLHTKTAAHKSNATLPKSAHAPETRAQSGELEAEADEDESSANDDTSDEEEGEPNEFALSDAQKWDSMDGQRLAGLDEDDMFMDDASQAVAGAEIDDDDESEDNDYAGVEDVSDDEEFVSEPHSNKKALRAAEQDLIDEFERAEERRDATTMTTDMDTMFLQDDTLLRARRSSVASNGTLPDAFNLNINMDDDPFLGLASHDSLYQDMFNEAEDTLATEDALASWRQPDRKESDDSMGTKKRVRFMEPHETRSRSSSLSSDEDPSGAFPDLFDAQDDPTLRSRFGIDVDLDASFQHDYSDTGSYYDFEGEEERLALQIDDEDSDTDDDLSSFDSDEEGDTTDEDVEDEPTARVQAARQAAGQSPTLAPSTPTSAKRPVARAARAQATPLSTPTTGKGPRMGTFVVDKSRATMSADSNGNRIKVLPPTKPCEKDKAFWDRARTAASSRSSTPRSSGYWNMRTPGQEMPPRPFTAQSTLRSMFNGNLDILHNNDVSGLAGDLFPGLATRPGASFASASMTEDSETEMTEVNMDDFLDMDDSDSESDELSSAPLTSPTQPGHSDPFTSRNDSLLNHLDQQRGLVGSFRRNQTQAKHFSSLAANPAKRASTSEHNALQKGRRAAANIPVTPARKKRVSQDLGLTGAGVKKAVSSPLASRRPRSRGSSVSGMQQTLSPSGMQ
ncbi:hypothetical protein LTR36_000675 [Oleoguttula mirabilis]|uniref:DNA replication checkpoint mediator MRC1 domain-containing protein n=1 Tax=Oleoguttula mirabilis TaxID=1507867 RepID=A0AAV9JQN7_9PEZI|nr:hypothetical protein LTR36_000675 [Oleoguttula mirabilis]